MANIERIVDAWRCPECGRLHLDATAECPEECCAETEEIEAVLVSAADWRGAVEVLPEIERWIARYDDGPPDAVGLLRDARALFARLTTNRGQ